MDMIALAKAAILGVLEGFTEFLPVSSTGHLLLAERYLGLGFSDEQFDKTFAVLIQLGSVLALLGVYTRKLLEIAVALPTDPRARTFAAGVLLAFLPAAIIGALAHGFIKGVLFNPLVICIALIVGGFVLIAMDERRVEPRYTDATAFPLQMYLLIGLCQCLAMIPGVSRSGATIVSAMLLGADKRSAAEFSFFLAMPTMAAAVTYDLYKNAAILSWDDAGVFAVGFVAAFVTALVTVQALLAYVSRHSFTPFGWYRIVLGVVVLWYFW